MQSILRALNLGDLAKHDDSVAFHDSNTAKTLTGLEGVDDEWLLWLHADLSDLIGLEGSWGLGLSSTSLLSDLPLDLRHAASRATSADESDWAVTNLELSRVVHDLNLSREGLSLTNGSVRLEDHDITDTRHVALWQVLDVKSDVVTRMGGLDSLVVHLDGEDLTSAWVSLSVGWEEENFVSRFDGTLLNATSEDISDTLDLEDTRDRSTHSLVGITLWNADHLLKSVPECVDVDRLGFTFDLDVDTLPPVHVLGLLNEVVTHPSRDREDRNGVLDEVLLPAGLGQHELHLVTDLNVARLLVASDITVHLVDTNDELLDTEKVDEDSVLTSLTLDLTSLVVALGDGSCEVTISRNHEKSNISLGCTGDHVLDEITMAWGINDGVVLGLGEEFLGGAGNGDTTLTLLLLAIHVEGESEGSLTLSIGLSAELLHLTLGDTAELEDEAASGGGLAGIDVTADNDRNVGFSFCHDDG